MMQFTLLADNTAQTTTAQGWESMIGMLVIIAGMFFIMWFMGRKQRKRQKLMLERRNALKNGDRVMMSCGIYGVVTDIKGDVVTIESGSQKIPLVFDRNYIATVEYDDDTVDFSREEAKDANK